jgi:hypothetical protein
MNYMQITVANAACGQSHKHLPAARFLDVNTIHEQVCRGRFQNGCFHLETFLSISWNKQGKCPACSHRRRL